MSAQESIDRGSMPVADAVLYIASVVLGLSLATPHAGVQHITLGSSLPLSCQYCLHASMLS